MSQRHLPKTPEADAAFKEWRESSKRMILTGTPKDKGSAMDAALDLSLLTTTLKKKGVIQ